MVDKTNLHQERVKNNFDKKVRPWSFMEWDMVLLWDKRREEKGANVNFDSL